MIFFVIRGSTVEVKNEAEGKRKTENVRREQNKYVEKGGIEMNQKLKEVGNEESQKSGGGNKIKEIREEKVERRNKRKRDKKKVLT